MLRAGSVTLPTRLERGFTGEMALAALDEFDVLSVEFGEEVCELDEAPLKFAMEGSR